MSLAGDQDTSSSLNSLNIAVNRSISFPSLTSSQSSPTNNIQNSSSRRDYIDFDSDDLIVKITQREFNNSQHTKSCQLVEEIASEKLKRCHSRAFHTENEDQFSRFELSVNRQLYEQYYNSEGPVDFLLVQLVMMMKMGMSFEEMEQVWNSMTSQGSFVRMGKFSSYLDKLTSSSVFKEWSANQFVKEMVKKRWKPQQQQVGSTTSFFNLNANTRPTMMATYNLSQNAIPPSMPSENPKKDDRSQLHEPKYKRFETPLPHPTSSTSNEGGKSNWNLWAAIGMKESVWNSQEILLTFLGSDGNGPQMVKRSFMILLLIIFLQHQQELSDIHGVPQQNCGTPLLFNPILKY